MIAGLHLAKMSSLPSKIVEEATAISVMVSGEMSLNMAASKDSPSRADARKLGMQLVQVARNSLLDVDALRSVVGSN